jgi:tRNA(His) 5'-end guanylyltransferase
MKYSEFDKRMKKYEFAARHYLTTRTPVIIRIDGKAFHTFTKGFQKPFDSILADAMQETMKYLCENIQGCVLGYTQSDEITLVLVDYKNIDTSAWFDYNIQKCASVTASMATMAFNKHFKELVETAIQFYDTETTVEGSLNFEPSIYTNHFDKAMFDARVFNIPKEEVCNNIYWRQQDAIRNSIQMLGRTYFSDRELHKKNTSQIKDMLVLEHGVNWDDIQTRYKRGSCCVRNVEEQADRSNWIIDNEIPIFKAEGRQYVEDLIWI